MIEVKEIKSFKIVPLTLMSSSISAILAFIGAIIMVITLGIVAAFLPPELSGALTGVGITAIIAYPIVTFLVGLSTTFLSVLLYNLLVPRVGGVKLALDSNQLESLPIVPFALILSLIMAIWTFIIGLVLAASVAPIITIVSRLIPIISSQIANATGSTAAIPTGEALGTGGVLLAVFLIIVLPILVFIFGFIGHALFAIFYNYIATRASKVQLNFTAMTGTWFDLTSIPVVPAALAIAVVFAVFGFIAGLGNLITLSANGDVAGGVGSLIGTTIGYFIEYFIITALVAIFYNFLAPRIGAVKLELE